MSRVIGIDPGVTGGVALLVDGTLERVVAMPVFGGLTDGGILSQLIADMTPATVVIEATQAMPKNGSIASHSLGYNSGVCVGVAQALQLPLIRVRPIEWKRAMGLIGKRKADSRALARELWPAHGESFKLVKQDGLAEAALIARWYGWKRIHEENA